MVEEEISDTEIVDTEIPKSNILITEVSDDVVAGNCYFYGSIIDFCMCNGVKP